MKEQPSDHTPVSIDGHTIPVSKSVFSRLEQALKEHELEAKIIGGIVVFGVAAAITAEAVHQHHKKHTAEAPLEPLTPEQESKFHELYEQHHQRIQGFLTFSRDIPVEEARDITQRIFLQARRHFAEFVPKAESEDPYKAWLYTIASNMAKNARRDSSRHPTIPLEDESHEEDESDYYPVANLEHLLVEDRESVEDQIIHRQNAATLKTALHSLQSEYQLIIWLKTLDFSTAEIKHVFGFRTENAAKAKYHRAIHALKNRLDKLE
jgi:RNA polymerase sigma factor (sigma-70 family)